MSPSKMRRTPAYDAGRLHAHGDECERYKYEDNRELAEAYDLGKSEAQEQIDNERDYHDNPLRKLQVRASALTSSNDSEVSELADIVEDLLLHMLNVEEGLV